MRSLRFLLALLLASLPSPSIAVEEAAAPQPQVVMIETDPWLMVIGSDSPAFALYDNGDVIYERKDGYRFVHLDAAARDTLLASMNLADAAVHQGNIETTDATDQPENLFFVFDSERPWGLRVYGGMAPSGTERDGLPVESAVPAAVQRLYDTIANFDRADATAWLPAKVEVMIWSYDYAPDPSIQWPAGWPGLEDADTRKRADDSYSLYVPSAMLPQLRAFLATRNERGAVEIGGKKWAVSLRYPFPGEEKWMGGGE